MLITNLIYNDIYIYIYRNINLYNHIYIYIYIYKSFLKYIKNEQNQETHFYEKQYFVTIYANVIYITRYKYLINTIMYITILNSNYSYNKYNMYI